MRADEVVVPDEAVDNDVVIKALRYRALDVFWPSGNRVGVLGAAKFVVLRRIKKAELASDPAELVDDLDGFLERADTLEPSDEELRCAAELEREAQSQSLPLDAGESQLVAMVVARSIPVLTTGDKRAITSIERLLGVASCLEPLRGRVRCLEQLVLSLVRNEAIVDKLVESICADRDADVTLSICFACYTGGTTDADAIEAALLSYIGAIRNDARELLIGEP